MLAEPLRPCAGPERFRSQAEAMADTSGSGYLISYCHKMTPTETGKCGIG